MQVDKGRIQLTEEEQVRFEVSQVFRALIQNQAAIVSREQGRKPITVYGSDGSKPLGRHCRGKWVDA